MNIWLLFIDAVLLYGTFLLSYLIRYGSNIPPQRFLPFREGGIFLVAIMIGSMVYAGLFRRRFRSYWLLFQKMIVGLTLGTCLCFIFMYLMREKWVKFPSSILVINMLLASCAIFLVNAVMLRLKRKIQKRVVILGAQEFDDPFPGKESLVRKKHISEIEELMRVRDVDEVMICKRLQDNANLNLLIFLLLRLKVVVTFSPAVYAELIADEVEQEETVNLFSTFIGTKSDSQEFFMRVLDIGVSALLVVCLAPLFVAIAVLLKCTSPGPVIYKQQRVGKDRELFTIYKFRTMTQDAEQRYGHKPALSDDERITRVGRFLRKTRLDELPQLVNILKGQMSLVGPRPENIARVNTHKSLRGLRLAVKPGLTGLAQIQSSYDLSPKHKIKYDFLYIQRRSFATNCYILLKTIPVILARKGQ